MNKIIKIIENNLIYKVIQTTRSNYNIAKLKSYQTTKQRGRGNKQRKWPGMK